MYKTVFNNASLSIVLLVATMVLGIGGGFLPVPSMPINIILLLAVIPVYLVAAVSLYPKGDLKIFITSTLVMLGAFVLSMLVISGVGIGMASQSIAGLELSISPVSLFIPIVMSVVIVKFFVTLEYVESKPEKVEEKIVKEEIKTVKQSVSASITSSIAVEEKPVKIDETPLAIVKDVKKEVPKVEDDVYLEDIIEKSPVGITEAKSLYDYKESDDKQEPEKELYLEDLMDTPVKTDKKPESVMKEVSELETFDSLGELPDIVEEKEEPLKRDFSEETVDQLDSTVTYKSTEDYVVPRLAETPTSKEHESGGKITSIGKLLVDHRDIENIIETNALMQSVGSDITSTKIISAIAGGKTNEKLAALGDLEGINATVIVNDAGFIQASTLNDLQKEQVIGAMASGTFGVISSTLSKMGFQPAIDITLKSDAQSLVLNKLTNNIIAIFVDANSSVYDTEDITQLLSSTGEMENAKLLELISSINGVIGTIISDEKGNLLLSKLVDDSKNPEYIATMLPAFYSNLGVFIKNMDQGLMMEAIISTGNEIILFTKVNTNIIMLYATPNTSIQPNDLRIQYEAIISN